MNPFIYARKVPEFRKELMKYMRNIETRKRLWIQSVSSSEAREGGPESTASVPLREIGRFNDPNQGRFTI